MFGFLKKIGSRLQDEEFKRLASNSGWTMAAKGAKSLEILLRSVLIARALGIENYAVFCLIMACVGTIQELFNANAGSVVVKFGAEYIRDSENEKFKSLVRFGMFVNLVLLAISIMVIVGTAYLYASIKQVERFENEALLVALSSGLAFFGSVFRASLLLIDKFRAFSIAELATAIINVAVIYVMITSLEASVFVAILAVFCCGVFTEILGFGVYLSQMPKDLRNFWSAKRIDKQERRVAVRFLVGNSASQSLQKLAKKGDVLIVGAFAGAVAVSFYDVAKKFSNALLLAIQPLKLAAFPQLAKLVAAKDFKKIFGMVASVYTVLALPIALVVGGLFFFGNWVIEATYGHEFLPAFHALMVLGVTSLLMLTFFWCNTFVLASGQLKSQFLSNLSGAIVTLSLGSVLTMWFGMAGMAYGVLLGSIVTYVMLANAIGRYVKEAECTA